jgi:hypothetical protein
LLLAPAGALFGEGQAAQGPGEEPCLRFRCGPDGLVGLVARVGDRRNVKLTYSDTGSTNYTLLRVDGKTLPFGPQDQPPDAPGGADAASQDPNSPVTQKRTFPGGITVEQEVRLVSGRPVGPGQAPAVPKPCTCLVTYRVKNTADSDRKVGLCVLIDTMVGASDNNLFAVPGKRGLVTTYAEFLSARDMPRYLKALERPEAPRPSAVAYLTLRLGGDYEVPSRCYLTHRPFPPAWDFQPQDLAMDSAVVLYWDPVRLEPGGKARKWAYAYGLGIPDPEGGGK